MLAMLRLVAEPQDAAEGVVALRTAVPPRTLPRDGGAEGERERHLHLQAEAGEGLKGGVEQPT